MAPIQLHEFPSAGCGEPGLLTAAGWKLIAASAGAGENAGVGSSRKWVKGAAWSPAAG
jgi:hypothetical protein